MQGLSDSQISAAWNLHQMPNSKYCKVCPYVTGCLYFFSCTVNPVLYNAMSAKYRSAFRKTLCCGQADVSSSREASTFRDTTLIYVNSHLDRCRYLVWTCPGLFNEYSFFVGAWQCWAISISYLLTYSLHGAGYYLKNWLLLSSSKNIPLSYETRRFITVFTKARHWTLSWASRIHFAPSIPISPTSILMLSSHLRLGLPSGLLPSGLPTKTL
jgi:hypothetical protein